MKKMWKLLLTFTQLLCSPNDHYLNDLIQKMVAADTNMATDHGGLRHIFHNVRAYIKVQRKYISELASKELIRTLILRTERSFYALIESGMSEYVSCIKEPEKLQRERNSMQTRQAVLQKALKQAQAVSRGV